MERSEAIEIVREYYPSSGKDLNEALETLIPELKESEDERIRKELIRIFKSLGDGKIPVEINYADIFTWLEKQGEQNYAWSKEDERMIGRIRGIIEQYAFSQSAVDVNGDLCEREFVEPDEWLKSLKERCTWKPSDEQIMALKKACDEHWEPDGLDPLYTLYQDLKKLKG